MASTYTPIATTTLGSSQATVTFNSFSGYTDLVIIVSARNTSGGGGDTSLNMIVNSDSGANYSFTQLYGNGSAASSNRASNTNNYGGAGRVVNGASTANYFAANVIQLNNYANTTTYKTFITRGNTAESYAYSSVGLWRSTAAITSVTFSDGGGANFATGSTFTLYGIKAA